MTVVLDVLLNDTLVGALTQLPGGQMVFSFDNAYFYEENRPVLSQSYYSETGELLLDPKAYNVNAPPFFSNLLPEGPLRNYLAERGEIKPSQEFKMLKLLGEDLPGAVIIRPSKEYSGDETDVEVAEGQGDTQVPLRFSLAGVQLKFSGLMERSGGLTIPASGMGGDWIIKLPAADHDNVPENEYAMMHMAGEIGIPIPEIKLVPLTDISGLPTFGKLRGLNALAVKRFDRGDNGSRTHIEDFAQVFDVLPNNKYEGVNFRNITQMIWTLNGEDGLRDFIKRLAFTVLTGNGDMHLKNWSFIYKDARTPELSPAYDMVSTVPYIPNDTLALNILKVSDMHLCDIALFEKMAEKAGVPKKVVTDTVKETIELTRSAWSQNKAHYDMPSEITKIVDKHMKDVF
ncbi:MAG: type II toxin-antitoxin system HipA family toxin [Alphaproteobacteria bacterium]